MRKKELLQELDQRCQLIVMHTNFRTNMSVVIFFKYMNFKIEQSKSNDLYVIELTPVLVFENIFNYFLSVSNSLENEDPVMK